MSDRMSDENANGATTSKTAPSANLAAARAALGQAGKSGERAAAAARSVPPMPAPVTTPAASIVVPGRDATSGTEAIQQAVAAAVARSTASAPVAGATQTPAALPVGGEQTAKTTTSYMERAMTSTEELMAFGQGNVEAFVKSGQIWASGMQDIGRHVAQSAQAHFDSTMSAFKAMATVKSVHEALELQSTMARTALEKVVQDGGKLTDVSMKLAEQTLAPITARVSHAAERFGRVAA